ncbi:MAG: Gfo/Idh/MocA family oxidoreductase [Anaerolineae bacterium]|nr:MAG: Gfo/Idh/MocA family oxidoreductase [Anaerolineae bacterium]
MVDKIRWGILGTGMIAHKFAEGLRVLPDAVLTAVGSRSQAAANRFGDAFDVPHRHATYQDLASDPEVDVIYVSSPHPMHKEDTLLCLEAGKAVLCEKPFTMNSQESEAVIRAARERGLFLMEAMWTRYLPAVVRARQLLAEGVIGEVRMVQADFGFRAEVDPKHRLLNPDLGGGALLDVGIYTVSLAWMVFGQQPAEINSQVYLGSTGVDELSGTIFRYPAGQIAVLSSSLQINTPHDAVIIGTKGSIRIHPSFWCTDGMTLTLDGQPEQVMNLPRVSNGYNYEAAEVMACLRAGKRESEVMPLDETLAIMQTLDRIRALWGLKYPTEK